MNDRARAIIELKLTQIAVFLLELEQVTALPLEDYIKDFRNIRTAERTFELLIEFSSDVIGHFLMDKGLPPAHSYRDIFLRASKAGVISISLSEKIIPLVALRNRIVHEYDEQFDPKRAYEGFRLAPLVFQELSRSLFVFLENTEGRL
ncbi:MAG: HepT-like ribonuclease domain-containing protein [Nitrospirota bacterium]